MSTYSYVELFPQPLSFFLINNLLFLLKLKWRLVKKYENKEYSINQPVSMVTDRVCLGRRFFMIFNNFGFSHGQISKFWKKKHCCHQFETIVYTWLKWRKVNLNQILNRNDIWEILRLFSHNKLQLNKLDFPLIFYLQELFLHLAELFKI